MDPPPTLPPSMPPLPTTIAPTGVMAAAATSIQTNNPDSVESSPRSRIGEVWNDELIAPVPGAKLRLMCSYGGHIMPRPHDKSLSYIGGDTRIVVVDRNSTLKDLCLRLSRTLLNGRPFTLKYQLPNEDLDNLISVTTDEDLDNMIEEYDRVAATSASPLKPSPSRLRVFLFFSKPETTVSMGSLLDDAKSETWFVDALNNSGILTRGVSDSAAGDAILNLDGAGPAVSGSGSSNNLEAHAAAAAESLTMADNITGNNNNNNSKVKNLQDIAAGNSLPGSPSSASSPSMANLPPIRVRVDDNGGSRLQQEQRVGVMEEQFAQMTIGASGVRQDEGFVVVPSAVAMPAAVPAATTTASAAMVTSNSSDNMNRFISDDERSDPGVPIGYGKPPLPLQLVQPRTGGGLSLPSPDSVTSDTSSIASTNSFTKNVYYQEQVQPSHVDNKAPTLSNANIEIREQIQDPNYTLPPQLDQNQQLHQQFVQASSPYIHHPAAATSTVPMSSYYPVYAPPPRLPSQPQLHQHPIPQTPQQQQYQPVYVLPVGHTHTTFSFFLSLSLLFLCLLDSGTHILTPPTTTHYHIHISLSLFLSFTVLLSSESINLTTFHLLYPLMEDLPQGYRPNVGVCLINSHNQVFVASRLNVPGAWQMPQGGIEDGEEPKSAAIRELREETGIASAEIIAEVPKWLTYDFPTPVKNKVNRLWGGEWHGQAQKWFLMQLRDDDVEVNLATGEADPEFAEWKWASPEEVIEEAVDYKRPTYEEVMRTFKPYFQGNAISAKCKSAKW